MTQGIRTFDFVTVYNVVDGDTVDCRVSAGFYLEIIERFRLARINTPERGQEGFAEAKQFVQEWIVGKDIRLKVTKADKWRRWLAEVEDKATGENLNDLLLTLGHARLYEAN